MFCFFGGSSAEPGECIVLYYAFAAAVYIYLPGYEAYIAMKNQLALVGGARSYFLPVRLLIADYSVLAHDRNWLTEEIGARGDGRRLFFVV